MSAAGSPWQQEMHALYDDHHGWLFGWLRRKLGSTEGAADLAQDTFLRIVASRDTLLGVREPRAFLVTTAQRLIIDQARRQAIEAAYLRELAFAAEHLGGAPSPEHLLETLQALTQIEMALDGLAAKPRQAFLLHYLDGETHGFIAEHLGVSTRMIQKYLVQALLHCHRHHGA